MVDDGSILTYRPYASKCSRNFVKDIAALGRWWMALKCRIGLFNMPSHRTWKRNWEIWQLTCSSWQASLFLCKKVCQLPIPSLSWVECFGKEAFVWGEKYENFPYVFLRITIISLIWKLQKKPLVTLLFFAKPTFLRIYALNQDIEVVPWWKGLVKVMQRSILVNTENFKKSQRISISMDISATILWNENEECVSILLRVQVKFQWSMPCHTMAGRQS